MIKINFEFDTKHGVYRDALYLLEDHTYSNADIEAMKNERVNNWIQIVENPLQTEQIEQSEKVNNG